MQIYGDVKCFSRHQKDWSIHKRQSFYNSFEKKAYHCVKAIYLTPPDKDFQHYFLFYFILPFT